MLIIFRFFHGIDNTCRQSAPYENHPNDHDKNRTYAHLISPPYLHVMSTLVHSIS